MNDILTVGFVDVVFLTWVTGWVPLPIVVLVLAAVFVVSLWRRSEG